MSTAPSRVRSRSRAPSNARTSAPIVVSSTPKPPIEVVIPAPPRPRSMSRGPTAFVDAPPGLSGGRGMFKRLIVACDGTWMNSDNGLVNGRIVVPSNVTRISRAIKAVSQDGIPQIVNYHFGVGTQGGRVNRLVSGTTGIGLSDNVREAYSFLANNYHPGDEIFLIGFSRGAFTARSIGGLIGEVGLLTKKGLSSLAEIYEDVRNRRNPDYVPKNPDVPFPHKPSANDPRYASELERRGLTRLDIKIKAIGVWDTVGSLGTPRVGWLTKVGLQSSESREMSFYDTKLSNCIENAFQALALDERRSAFAPAVWEKPAGNRTTLRQVWFPGAHSNVGGGYDDQQLANITLAWMMSQLAPFLDLREEYVFEQEDENEHYYRDEGQEIRPWGFGEIPNSMKGLYALGGRSTRTPGLYKAVDPYTGRTTDRPLHLTNEYIHASVRARIRLDGPGTSDKGPYDCRALTDNYKLVVDYGPNATTAGGDPDIYWKLKFRDPDAVKILPEAPLWGVEKELCRRDARSYEWVRKPPATGVPPKKSRKSAAVGAGAGGLGSPRRRSVVEGSAREEKRRSFVEDGPRDGKRRSKSGVGEGPRERPRSFDERSSVVRASLPHRRAKDRAWWEGEEEERVRERERERDVRRERRRSGGPI